MFYNWIANYVIHNSLNIEISFGKVCTHDHDKKMHSSRPVHSHYQIIPHNRFRSLMSTVKKMFSLIPPTNVTSYVGYAPFARWVSSVSMSTRLIRVG